jgi:hypothetical protein
MARPGRPKKIENMTAFELQELQNRITAAKEAKRKQEAASLRDAIMTMAKRHGFNVKDLLT